MEDGRCRNGHCTRLKRLMLRSSRAALTGRSGWAKACICRCFGFVFGSCVNARIRPLQESRERGWKLVRGTVDSLVGMTYQSRCSLENHGILETVESPVRVRSTLSLVSRDGRIRLPRPGSRGQLVCARNITRKNRMSRTADRY